MIRGVAALAMSRIQVNDKGERERKKVRTGVGVKEEKRRCNNRPGGERERESVQVGIGKRRTRQAEKGRYED